MNDYPPFPPYRTRNDEYFVELPLSEYHKIKDGFDRYEKVRKLNPRQFKEIYEENIKTGVPFDELIDRLTKE